MFGNKSYEKVIAALQVEKRDLLDALLKERESFAKERKELLDRLLAVESPAAHRLVHPSPASVSVLPPKAAPAPRWPGYRPNTDPPRPSGPPMISQVVSDVIESD